MCSITSTKFLSVETTSIFGSKQPIENLSYSSSSRIQIFSTSILRFAKIACSVSLLTSSLVFSSSPCQISNDFSKPSSVNFLSSQSLEITVSFFQFSISSISKQRNTSFTLHDMPLDIFVYDQSLISKLPSQPYFSLKGNDRRSLMLVSKTRSLTLMMPDSSDIWNFSLEKFTKQSPRYCVRM